jgi:hypothetical protein
MMSLLGAVPHFGTSDRTSNRTSTEPEPSKSKQTRAAGVRKSHKSPANTDCIFKHSQVSWIVRGGRIGRRIPPTTHTAHLSHFKLLFASRDAFLGFNGRQRSRRRLLSRLRGNGVVTQRVSARTDGVFRPSATRTSDSREVGVSAELLMLSVGYIRL